MVLDMFVFIEARVKKRYESSGHARCGGRVRMKQAIVRCWQGLGAVATYIVFIMDYVPQATTESECASLLIYFPFMQHSTSLREIRDRYAHCGVMTTGAQTS